MLNPPFMMRLNTNESGQWALVVAMTSLPKPTAHLTVLPFLRPTTNDWARDLLCYPATWSPGLENGVGLTYF